MSTQTQPLNFNIPGPKDNRTEKQRETDVIVRVRFKDEPEDTWHEGAFSEDHMLYIDGHEVTRYDFLLEGPDGELIDMEEEYQNYRMEKLRERLHLQARYLANQALAYNKE